MRTKRQAFYRGVSQKLSMLGSESVISGSARPRLMARAFAIAFWPDSRGATPKTLAELISAEDPVIYSREEFAAVSIAARGFHALEFLLFDPRLSAMQPGGLTDAR